MMKIMMIKTPKGILMNEHMRWEEGQQFCKIVYIRFLILVQAGFFRPHHAFVNRSKTTQQQQQQKCQNIENCMAYILVLLLLLLLLSVVLT